MPPTVSVIMPAFNREKYIAAAIQSALDQLDERDEILVVDNASTDATARIVKSVEDARIRYFFEPKKGAAAARNHAFRHMRGELVAFLDSDDLWPEGRQQLLLNALEQHPEANAAYGRIRFLFCRQPESVLLHLDGVLNPFHSLCTFLFHRSLLEECGEMDEALLLGEDTDYLIRIHEAGMLAIPADGDAYIYRRHDSNSIAATFDYRITLGQLSRKIRRRRPSSP